MSDCTCVVVEIITTQRSVTTSRPNTNNTDVEKLQLATFNKLHTATRKRRRRQRSESERERRYADASLIHTLQIHLVIIMTNHATVLH